jgi:type III secretion protein V
LVVYLLGSEIESLLANQEQTLPTAFLAQLQLEDRDRILTAVRAEFGALPVTAQDPVVLTISSVRPIFRRLIATEFPRVATICYQEISPDMNIQPMRRISLH